MGSGDDTVVRGGGDILHGDVHAGFLHLPDHFFITTFPGIDDMGQFADEILVLVIDVVSQDMNVRLADLWVGGIFYAGNHFQIGVIGGMVHSPLDAFDSIMIGDGDGG